MQHNKVRALCEAAIMVAVAQVLGYIKLIQLPQGGSVSICMLPLLFYCVRWGLKNGFLACFAFGLLQLIFDGAYAWSWQCMFLDYILAYTAMGVAGLGHKKKGGIFWGSILGAVCRFAFSFISGVTIYRIYEPTELFDIQFLNPYLYSFAYNGSYIGLSLVACLAIFAVLYKPLKKYFYGEDLIDPRTRADA